MPSFVDRYEDLDLWDVVAYMRTLVPRVTDLDPSIETAQALLSVLEQPDPRGQFVSYLAARGQGDAAPQAAVGFSTPDADGRVVGVVLREKGTPVGRAFRRDQALDTPPTTEEVESIVSWVRAGQAQAERDTAKATELAARLASAMGVHDPTSALRGKG